MAAEQIANRSAQIIPTLKALVHHINSKQTVASSMPPIQWLLSSGRDVVFIGISLMWNREATYRRKENSLNPKCKCETDGFIISEEFVESKTRTSHRRGGAARGTAGRGEAGPGGLGRVGAERGGARPREKALWNFMAQLLNLKEFLPQHCGRNARQGLDQKTLPSTKKKQKIT